MLDETKALFPPAPPLTRRGFVAASLATAGYTLAAGPIAAQTIIRTDTTGLTAGDVRIPVADGQMGGYRAKPASGNKFPVILVVQEIFGLHEYIKDVCRRLGKIGYLAVAPDIYFRQGDPAKAADVQAALAITNKKPDAELMSDLDATMRWAATADGGDANRLGITGFCRGGRTVWLYAAHNANLKAGVAWYGPLGGQPTALMPKQPLELVAELKAPVLGLYGGADSGIPLNQVERMRAALKEEKKPSEIVVYPDAPHGFHADYRSSYRAEAAMDGWRRMQDWFRTHGVA